MRSGPLVLVAVVAGCGSGQDFVVPNDPYLVRQVSFSNPGGEIAFDVRSSRASPRSFSCVAGIDIDVARAWSVTTGSRDVVVAVLDDGFPYDHEDVRENVWRNPGETGVDSNGYRRETNGVDDDGNGYTDDVVGWDWAFDDPDPDCYVFDGRLNSRIQPYWHAISAMGIIGARGDNGIGIAGINWEVSMMLLKLCPQGTWPPDVHSRADRAAKAIRYAADNGARVINWSGFLTDAEPEELALVRQAIEYAATKDVLLVVAAGNSGKDLDVEENRIYPQCFDCDNILVVAEIDLTGRLDRESGRDGVSSSNYGAGTVDIAAVGRNYTTALQDGRAIYGLGGGTSDAAPVVTGVAALILSVDPDLGYRELRDTLLRTAEKLPELLGSVRCSGMVDAYAAVTAVAPR